MVIDSLQNIERYYALLPALSEVSAFLRGVELSKLEVGRHAIDGDRLFVNVAHDALRSVDEAPMEVHNRYADVQLVVEGEEGFGWRERGECTAPQGAFDAERDILFYADKPQTVYRLHAGQFAIFFPEDAHAPLLGEGSVRKLIFKVEL